MSLDVRVTGAESMADLGARLRRAANGGELKKNLTAEIRTVTGPVVADLRTAVRGVTSRASSAGGGGSVARHRHAVTSRRRNTSRSIAKAHSRSGLRDTIAAAIVVRTRLSGNEVGVRILVDLSKLPADQRTLPAKLDAAKGWRHPVYGNRRVWVTQVGRPWWFVTIEPHLPGVRACILAAIDKTIAELEA